VFDIGSSLREARLRQELDFPELEARTKIRPKYLRALEDEQFDVLPAPTYIKGFLRSYAEALGLDGQPFVDEYNSRFTIGDEYADIRTRRVPIQRHERSTRESRIAVGALLAIAVLTALVIAAWRFGGPENENVPRLDAQSPGVATVPVGVAAGRVNLVVRAVGGDSWMEVRAGSASGRLLYSGTLERGQRKTFQGRRLQVAFRDPENVAVRLNGNRVGLPAGTAFVVTARRIVTASSS
jgi:cytoskeleton protein RodZ